MTTAQLKKRLDDLAPSGECSCPEYALRVLWPEGHTLVGGAPAPDPGPEVCPKCGRQRVTVIVEYTTNWRGEGAAE